MQDSELSMLRAAWDERWETARRQAEERAAQARSVLPSVVRRLKEDFGARRIVLFGSLARGEFGLTSDIDLLVEGIPPDRFFHACAAADRVARDFTVDLVPAETARPLAREAAARDGEVLLDAP